MKIYKINDNKFKSIYISYNFTMPVESNDIFSNNSVLGALMAKSSKQFPNQKEIERYLNGLYGASYDVNVEKFGDLYNLEFRAEVINKKFLPEKEDVLEDMLSFISSMIYEPADWTIENISREKEFILERINERKDEKLKYGVQKMEELLCGGEPFGNFLFGNIEDVLKIDKNILIDSYKKLICAPVTIIVSGNLDGYDNIDELFDKYFKNKIKLNDICALDYNTRKNNDIKFEEVKEEQDTTQSILSLGFKIIDSSMEDFYALNLYNAILGTTPSSKLFQNVREKESLAYTVRSRYYRFKNMLVIYAGINKENYTKAVDLIKEQIESMKKGEITTEEFTSAKDSLMADLNEWKDSKVAMAKMVFSNIIAYNDANITIDQMRENINKVTIEDVIKVANKVNLEKIFYLGGSINE